MHLHVTTTEETRTTTTATTTATSSLVPALAYTNLNATSTRTHDLCPTFFGDDRLKEKTEPKPDFRWSWSWVQIGYFSASKLPTRNHFLFRCTFQLFHNVAKAETEIKSACRSPLMWAKLAKIIVYEIRHFQFRLLYLRHVPRHYAYATSALCFGGGDRRPDYAIITFYDWLQMALDNSLCFHH